VSGDGRRALVTGGAGFVGSHVAEELVADGWRVCVFDDFSSGRASNLAAIRDRLEIVRGDVRDAAALEAAAAGAEVVFHQAAIASVPRSLEDPLGTDAVNLGGTLRVLEAARRCGVRRVVFAGSSAVYGNAASPPLRESEAPDPLSPYAVQKLAAERYLRLYADLYGLETVCLRYFNVYGDRQDPTSDYAAVVPLFLRAARLGRPLRIHGDGRQTRDFVHVADVARANRYAADAPGVSGECFNVASGRGTRVSELAETVARQTGRKIGILREPARRGDVRESWADVEASRKRLGFEARIDLDSGIKRTLLSLDAEEDPRDGLEEVRE
jgi:UDP-glucose 4-epimerase